MGRTLLTLPVYKMRRAYSAPASERKRSLHPLVFAFSDSRLELAGLVRVHDEILYAGGGACDSAGCMTWLLPSLVCVRRCSVMPYRP